jgi:hypothetical protein
MKTSIAKLALGLTLASMSSVALAGIANTKHNLGSSPNAGNNGAGWNFTTATTEICVFCHTPHGADSSAAVPLWNRHLSTGGAYNTYASLQTSTLDAPHTDTGSVSLACLSCHDGTQAMNTVINSPGSGTTGSIGSSLNQAAGGDWVEFGQMSGAITTEMIYIGTDLRNDHPISIQYAGQADGHPAYDTDFKTALSTSVASGTTVWYIDTNGDSSKDKHDLPLYNRSGFGALVECATCHDPHTENTTFLRHNSGNNGSATCLSCHVK